MDLNHLGHGTSCFHAIGEWHLFFLSSVFQKCLVVLLKRSARNPDRMAVALKGLMMQEKVQISFEFPYNPRRRIELVDRDVRSCSPGQLRGCLVGEKVWVWLL